MGVFHDKGGPGDSKSRARIEGATLAKIPMTLEGHSRRIFWGR